MRKILFATWIMIVLAGCSNDTKATTAFDYEGTLVGNNSDVVSIVNSLGNGDSVEKIELHTKAEPYGLTIHYDNVPDGNTQAWMHENAVNLFVLIDNVEKIDMQTASETYSFSKEEVGKEYNKNIDAVTTEEEWKEMQEWIN